VRVGRFELRCQLGSGAFGAVYRAYDPRLRREVALKLLHESLLHDREARRRFRREARAAVVLRHPHIVRIYEAGKADGRPYIASTLIEGPTLAAALDGEAFDCRRAAQVVRALADALHHAHRQDVLHRDVKPANVLLDKHGEPHLVDFGLAYRAAASKLTLLGTVLGTPAYMAPEALVDLDAEPQATADQYSLGVLFYELLTGKTPFTGPPAVVMCNVLRHEPPPPRGVNPKVPRDLELICLKCLSKDPAQRYADCGALADDLRRWLDDAPIRLRQPGRFERLWNCVRRQPLRTALLGTLLCLAVVALCAWWSVPVTARTRADVRTPCEDGDERKRSVAEAGQRRPVQEAAVPALQPMPALPDDRTSSWLTDVRTRTVEAERCRAEEEQQRLRQLDDDRQRVRRLTQYFAANVNVQAEREQVRFQAIRQLLESGEAVRAELEKDNATRTAALLALGTMRTAAGVMVGVVRRDLTMARLARSVPEGGVQAQRMPPPPPLGPPPPPLGGLHGPPPPPRR
jgi:hypothetical protein